MCVPFVQDRTPIRGTNIIKFVFDDNPYFDLLYRPAKGVDIFAMEKCCGGYGQGLRIFPTS